MTLALQAFDTTALHELAWVEIGRAIGHDLARFNLSLDPHCAPACVVEGFNERLSRTHMHDASNRYERKWVRLRLNAFMRERVADAAVTPAFLQSIDVDQCPVLRIKLTHAAHLPSDWSVDRLNNDGAYAPGNLAVMSTAANTAKSGRSFRDVLALANQPQMCEGLTPDEWMRLACLMLGPCFANTPQHAPALPLVTPIPKFTVRTAMQQVQYALTSRAASQSGKNALIKHFAPAAQTERSKSRFMFLAEAVHQGLKSSDQQWDVWLQARTMHCLADWRSTLDDPAWALAGEIAGQLNGARKVGTSRIRPWMLESKGYRATV